MSRVLHSYAGELKRIKNGPKNTLSTLLIGAATSLLVTCVLIESTFSGGLPEWIKLTGRSLYWHQFKHIETQEGLLRLSDKEIKELSQFVATWRSHEGLHSLYFWTAIGVACLSILLWVWMRTWLCANSKLSEQVREGEQSLVSSKALSKLIRKAVENPARPHSFREHDVILGRQKIRVCNETMGLHLGIGGASQTGKTNAINQVLQSRRLAGEKVLIVDPGGEFYARFGRTGDVILSLHDTRAVKWDFWSEGVSEEEMAKALVEVRDGMDASTKFFQTTGRAVLTSLFRIAGKDTEPLRELWRLANLPAEELEAVLKKHNEISHRYLGQGESGQASGVIATSLMNLEFLKYLNHHAREREKAGSERGESFSIRNWVLNENAQQWVFLVATDSHWEQTRPLIRLWFDIASTAILERETQSEKPLVPLWLVCDEISTVGLLPSLPKVLDRGYKYAGRLILGFQSLAQIGQIYGQDATHNIMQGLQNILIFAANETKMAQEFSDRLGKCEVEEYESSITPAHGQQPERVSISTRQREKRSVTESEIRSLPENHGFLKLARFPPTKVEFDYVTFPNVNDKSGKWSRIPTATWLDDVSAELTAPLEDARPPQTSKPRSLWSR
jgi:type IV secretory pathway TraG/TraD family ATPase VirD4